MLVLSVSSLKGGVGKTSVTLGLASAALSRGIPTLVVDMDPQADASTGLDVPVTTPVDIADVLSAPKSKLVDESIVASGWVDGDLGRLDVIPGSPRAAEFDRPSLSERYLKRLREALNRHATNYRLVIIDCPPSLNGLTRAAWTASQRVLVVTEPSLFSVAAADRALRATDEIKRRSAPNLQPLGIVVNRVRPSSKEQSFRITELRDMFGPLVLNPALSERTVLQQAQGSARPIHDWPGTPASELAAGFDQILDRALRSESIRASRKASKPAADSLEPVGPQTAAASGPLAGTDATVDGCSEPNSPVQQPEAPKAETVTDTRDAAHVGDSESAHDVQGQSAQETPSNGSAATATTVSPDGHSAMSEKAPVRHGRHAAPYDDNPFERGLPHKPDYPAGESPKRRRPRH